MPAIDRFGVFLRGRWGIRQTCVGSTVLVPLLSFLHGDDVFGNCIYPFMIRSTMCL